MLNPGTFGFVELLPNINDTTLEDIGQRQLIHKGLLLVPPADFEQNPQNELAKCLQSKHRVCSL